MKLISWNVNGIRACAKKGFTDWLSTYPADIIVLQETKASVDQLDEELTAPKKYDTYFASNTVKKGHSGVAIYSSKKIDTPKVTVGIGVKKFDDEGRTLIAEYNDFILYCCYFPNGRRDLSRVDFKLEYSDTVLAHALKQKKSKKKEIIIAGDYNTAHSEIDLRHPKTNVKNTGFLPRERAWIDKLISKKFIDIFREQHPEEPDHYTWWTYRMNCRAKNVGWRIDYFFISEKLKDRIKKSFILPDIHGSDHCPLGIELKKKK
jgi:exodeoxyribonuclease III